MKKFLIALLFAGLCVGTSLRAADTAPKTVVHIVTVAWKEGTTPAQVQAALDAAQKLPQSYKGLLRVWTKAVKIQDAKGAEKKKNNVIVMEFANQAAFDAYTDSDAQKEWYKTYLPIREVSTTFDVTN